VRGNTLVVVEKGKTSHGAYVPDLPGCVAVAETRREVLKLIREGITLHIEALREAGEPVPPPISKSQVVKVRAAQQSLERAVTRGWLCAAGAGRQCAPAAADRAASCGRSALPLDLDMRLTSGPSQHFEGGAFGSGRSSLQRSAGSHSYIRGSLETFARFLRWRCFL